MTSFNAYAQHMAQPAARREVTGEAVANNLESSIDELIASIPTGPPPLLPRKSSLRQLHRLSIQNPSAYAIPSSPSSNSHGSTGSIDNQHRSDPRWRWSSYSSVRSSPIEPHFSYEPRSSTSSRTTWSDSPPDYDSRRHSAALLDRKRASTILSDEEKQVLRAEYPDEQADLDETRSISVYSQGDVVADLPDTQTSIDSRKLFINAKGVSSFRLPLASKELEIQISDPNGHVVYISSRSKRSSADASLSRPGLGEAVRTSYGKRTLITCRNVDLPTAPFTIVGSRLRRRQSFTLPNGRDFEWRYTPSWVNGKREERLVLVQTNPDPLVLQPVATEPAPETSKRTFSSKRLSRTFNTFSTPKLPAPTTEQRASTSPARLTKTPSRKAPKPTPRVLAQLSRTDKSLQASGKKKSTRAGMGGELTMEPGCTDVLPEEIVVATALVMLKREQDRLGAVQAAVLVTILL